MSEKYCLSIENSLVQIVDDIYFVSKNDVDRGSKLFNEYLCEYNLEDLFKVSLNKDTFVKFGYIYRLYGTEPIHKNIASFQDYTNFVDGWLEAGSNLTSEVEIKKTFKFKKYHIDALSLYISKIIEDNNLSEDSYKVLLDYLLVLEPVEDIIELCTYGLLNSYQSENGVSFVVQHIGDIKNKRYEYEDKRILIIIKALFCIYGRIEESVFDDYYKEILSLTHNSKSDRGYKPAMAQYNIAKHIFEQYYFPDKIDILTSEDIYNMIYFANKHGAGSTHDCNGYKVVSFLEKVLVRFAENNPQSDIILTICNVIVQCLNWDITHYIADFNILFCLIDAHDDFLKVAEYWCGEDGVAWRSEYDEMEFYCKSIISTLEFFEEDEFITNIIEKQKYKMFGYVGRKDYSLNGLLECYNKIPLSEEKLCNYGMRLFSISNSANNIGDNRYSNEIDKVLFDNSVKLGYKYCNAFFELNNKPKDLVYWRMNLLDSLYNNIDMINDDSELIALYKLTNAWIKPYIEQDKPYGKLETLKEYNYKAINRISNIETREELISRGMYGIKTYNDYSIPNNKTESFDILELIREEGYNYKIENLIISQIELKSFSLHNIIIDAGDIISEESLGSYVNKCVVKYILTECEYGYIYNGLNFVFERYYKLFNQESWEQLFKDIVRRFENADYEKVASFWGDFTIFSIYYLLKKDSEKIKELFNYLCDAHEKLSSANGHVKIINEKLELDNDIKLLSDMVEFQLEA